MDADKLEELERLLRAGTPGKWHAIKNTCFWELWVDDDSIGDLCASDIESHPLPHGDGLSNAALICAAINALPELVARVRALEDALKNCADELEDELRNRHQPDLHPVSERRFKRDMDTVRDARALLKGTPT
jgi:hypothetical protein